eukprot:scaffold19515_cov31-Tisochrysis_lutea.AAC.6
MATSIWINILSQSELGEVPPCSTSGGWAEEAPGTPCSMSAASEMMVVDRRWIPASLRNSA